MSIELIYECDEQTKLPQLRCPQRSVPPEVLKRCTEELRSQQEKLQMGQLRTVKFKYQQERYPHPFLVEVTDQGDPRMKTILFRTESPRSAAHGLVRNTIVPPPDVPPVSSPTWREEFLAELERFAASLPTQNKNVSLGLQIVLDSLRQRLQADPTRFSLMLLQGFLDLAERECLQGTDPDERLPYVLTRKLLQQAFKLPQEHAPRWGLVGTIYHLVNPCREHSTVNDSQH